MSFRMQVRVERVLEAGVYDAVLDNIEEKDTKNGERLMWTFRIPGEDDTTVTGWSSLSPSTRAKAYNWALSIMGEVDPKRGWGPEDVIGGACRVVLDTYVDGQSVEKNGVDKVLRPQAPAADVEEDPEGGFEDLPYEPKAPF